MLKLKQYFCKHEFYLIARNKLVSEEMYQCWKCDVYEVRHIGILTRFKAKNITNDSKWDFLD